MLTNLQTALLDLLYELQNTDIKLIIGGGYGLFLRTELVRISGKRTLLKQLPEVRSTNDLDLFLRPELLIDSHKLKPLSRALIKLSYSPVTLTESEWEYALQLSARFGNHPYAVDAGRLVSKYFSDTDRLGIIRLKESPYYHSALQMDEFISAMSELFPYI
ncbi:MAG: hypothetical protein JXB48_09500 [Candidatus Latescibacteria bacterium]|nr:hypothetical protein [Candidatus Latescibacterota bacterium]